jgi:hypothetical protein
MNNKGWKAESDRRELKRRQASWGIASSSLATLLMVSFAAGDGWSRDQITGDTSAKVDLTVLVFIYAPIAEHDLAIAERTASDIFQNVGVQMSWVDCPLTRPRAELNPACTTPHTPTDIRLNVVPDIAEGPWVEKFAMGMAVPIPPPRHGQFAYISYARAKTVLLETPQLSLGQLLGHGIAHEIGHLLLGTNSHSPSGLMSAHWNARELKLAARGQLTFSIDQAAAIRGDVRARRAQQETTESEHVAPQK